ncbi:SH3 domain-containing protein [Haloechinothrix halophila]|uniref:hypothetical protein n=1 Tax=Haloechinothrix halophila TaxID=1069073 RepID=UPI0003FB9CAC|nr:hypothetical protein [Haloechinothrix halophila]
MGARVGLAGLLLILVGCGASSGDTPRPDDAVEIRRPILLVSGRTDHGDLALPRGVPLFSEPEGETVDSVADGTLVRVLTARGHWHKVRTVAGPPAEGWINDFRLRGVVHLSGEPPNCRPSLDGATLRAGEQAEMLDASRKRIRVRLIADPSRTGWVPIEQVHELPPDKDCGHDGDGHDHGH